MNQSKSARSADSADDFASTTLPNALASALTPVALTTIERWLDSQTLDEGETENVLTELPHSDSCLEPEATVRLTVDLPRSLHKRLKLAAFDRDQPMTDLARLALLEWLDAQKTETKPQEGRGAPGMQQLSGDANGDDLRMSSWWESRGVSRSAAFRLVKLAGIEPIKRKIRGVRVPVTFLDAGQVARLDAIVDRLNEGETIAQVEAAWKPIPVPA